MNTKPAFGAELFVPPHRDKILRILPTLFTRVDLENRRGHRMNMGVGFARERVLIALLMHVYGTDSVEFPYELSPEMDIIVNDHPLSIKTKAGTGFSGVKLVWTSDRIKIEEFYSTYNPSSELLYVNVVWDSTGKFCLIPLSVQQEIFSELRPEGYIKLPKEGTNSRGVEIEHQAMRKLQSHSATRCLEIPWNKDPSLPGEVSLTEEWTPYHQWLEIWENI